MQKIVRCPSTDRPDRIGRTRVLHPHRLALAAVLMLCAFVSQVAVVRPVRAQAQQPGESAQIAQAWTGLTSEGLGLAERAAAATELLEMRNDEATGALSLALTTQQSRVGWRAVIQAIATFRDDPPRDLAPPLIGLLGEVDAGLSQDLAAALGRFDQPDIIKRLTKIARNSQEPVARRAGTILTLGHDRTQGTAKLLMQLTAVGQPEQIQQAAFTALGTLTALDYYDADRQAWSNWWNKYGGYWDKEWTQHLLENFERREARRRAQDHQLEDKLLESQRALYQANSPEGKPAVLVYMLRDEELAPIRQLGMDLIRQRLLDDLPFEEPLREALRARLTDALPPIRADAALRLRYLSDIPAAELVAQRLREQQEQVSSVLGAYLRMMARLPQALAIDPAIDLLNDEALRADAAASLAASFDAQLMDKKQVIHAAKLIRKYLVGEQPPAPQVITLMGKVGNKDDWRRIASWVDHEDAAVKQAAAQAWADSNKSLNLLADRVKDPVIQPILIAAAAHRGDEPYTLRLLTATRPKNERAAEAWRRALVVMAQRVPADAVLTTDRQLSQLGGSAQMRMEVLSAAINRPQADGFQPADRLELMLSRGEVLLSSGDPTAALADFQVVAAGEQGLDDAQRDRLGRGQVSASLKVGQIDQAFAAARKLLGPAPARGISPTDDRIIAQFIQTAQRFRRDNRREEVATIARELRNLLEPAIKPEVGQQLARLEDWANGSANTPQPMTSADESGANDVAETGERPAVE